MIVAVSLLLSAFVVTMPSVVKASDDYDVQSGDWNGLQELVRIAQQVDVELRPTRVLDWSEVRRGDGLLIIYPRANIELADLSGFLDDGGRLALMDDFGDAGPLLRWFQVSRSDDVTGAIARSTAVPGLLIAWRRSDHPLGEGIDQLVTNEPVTLFHPRLSPVFALTSDEHSGVVLAGQVGRGRLVISGDPSVLINTMMRFPGNRHFARNLLTQLAGRPGGRVHLVHSSFVARGVYHGRRAQGPVREVVQSVNDALERLGRLAAEPTPARILALLLATVAALALGFRIWGNKPSDRFGPTAPAGAVASVAEKVAIFSGGGANLFYPALIAKRHLDRTLLRAVGLKPPANLTQILDRAGDRLTVAQRDELRSVLIELDTLGSAANDSGSVRVPAQRFLSLWRRINAILVALGDA